MGGRMLTVHNFSYGLLTPVLGYLMSCMGAFLGLRCTARAFAYQGWARARWLLFAGVSIGITGIWAMHFIAMLIVGFRGDGYRPLLLAGLITGLGVASMHYMGMAAMRMPGRIAYNPGL